MSSISQTTNTPSVERPISLADLQKAPSALSTALSFLTDREKQECHLLSKTWDQLSKPVERGYGDFILVDTTGADVNYKTYKAVFSSLNKYLPQVHQRPLSDRLKQVNEEIHTKYPKLQAVFIPRALYELLCILSLYREELALAKSKQECDASTICFHSLTLFEGTDLNNLQLPVIELAFRLNRFIVKELRATAKGVTEIECQRADRTSSRNLNR